MTHKLILLVAASSMLFSVHAAPAESKPQVCQPAIEIKADKTIVVVRQKGLGGNVKGLFKESDEFGITVEQVKTAERIAVPWGSVRKIKRKNPRAGFWSGLFIGTALAGASLLGDDGPSAAVGAVLIGVGAGVGAVAGTFADRPICVSPDAE